MRKEVFGEKPFWTSALGKRKEKKRKPIRLSLEGSIDSFGSEMNSGMSLFFES